MHFNKRLFSILLAVMLLVTLQSIPLRASAIEVQSKAIILTESIPKEVVDYAKGEFAMHFQVACNHYEEFDMDSADINDYSLEEPFKLYDEDDSYDVYYFPVVYSHEIVFVLTVTSIAGKLCSSFGEGFAKNLNYLYTSIPGEFIVVQDDSRLVALSKDVSVTLQQGAVSTNDSMQQKVKPCFQSIISSGGFSVTQAIDGLAVTSQSRYIARIDPGAPREWNTLNIAIVNQPNNYWCWAACCAMIINYKTGTSLTAQDVVVRVKGSAVLEGGNWYDIQEAFNSWDLYANLYNPMSYALVKNFIDDNEPILMSMRNDELIMGHTILLKGYEKYSDGNYYIVIDPYLTSPTSIRAASTPSDVYYTLAGRPYYWVYAVTSF